jgi:hypothetical protein
MRYFFCFLFAVSMTSVCTAQDPEFPAKEFIMHLRLHNGMITNFKSSAPDLYAGGMQLIPQFTVVKNKLRLGAVGGVFYASKNIQALIGPTVSLKLKSINAGIFGSGGNIHLSFDHLWGTKKQRLIGGGFNLDIANKIVLNFTIHRDYKLNSWWLGQGVSFRISKVKKVPEI